MKSLQKVICTIFLAAFAFTGCELAAGGGGGSTQTDGDVSITVTDSTGTETKLAGDENNVTVRTRTATVTVNAPSGTEVKIDGEIKTSKQLSFTQNGETQPVKIAFASATKTGEREISVRYYIGAIENIIVKDENGKESKASWNNTSFVASVGTKKATLTVKTFGDKGAVKIDGTDGNSKSIEFTGSTVEIPVTVSVSLDGNNESFTGKIYYSDPAALPVDNVLTSLKITDASVPSTTYALIPPFNPDNTNYKVVIPSSGASKIKVEATAATGIAIDGTEERDLTTGDNTITVTARLVSNMSSAHTYKILVKKVAAGASTNADLKSLKLQAKYIDIPHNWVTAPAEFNKGTTEYTCEADTYSNELYITAETEESSAVMTVTHDSAITALEQNQETKFTPLKHGLNTYVITVTAPDAVTTKTYTVKATRKEGSYVLKSFSATGTVDFYTPAFNDYKKKGTFGTKTFDVYSSNTATSTTIRAEAEFPASTTIKIKVKAGKTETEEDFTGTKEVSLTEPETRVQLILSSTAITPDEFSPRTYTLKINKPSATGSDDATLKNLQVSYFDGFRYIGQRFNETFNPNTTDYTVQLPSGVKEIKVDAEKNHSKAGIEGWFDSSDLFFGPFDNKKIEIPVVSENGTRKTYSITVTQEKPVSLTINMPPADTVINVSSLSADGYEVKGSFTNDENAIKEIWVGSSGLPIQQELGNKWVKATIDSSNKTFTAKLTTLKDLPNGARDIKAVAFNAGDAAIAVARVQITVQGSSVAFNSVNAEIQPNGNVLPSDGTLTLYAFDKEYWYKKENVVSGYIQKPLAGIAFPTTLSVPGVTANRESLMYLEIRDSLGSLVFYGKAELNVSPNTTNTCKIEVQRAQ
ncbi:MAG: cadherin-like beta sandwich domain-containing protein [Treponema sp.]